MLILVFPGLTGLVCEIPTEVPSSPTPPVTLSPSATPLPQAMVTFRVALPAPLAPGETVLLNILDEVTGLALNPTSYPMQADDAQHFIKIIPIPLNSVIKYRYSRQGTKFVQEHVSDGRSVRYRMFSVESPGIVQDVISRWTDTEFSGPTGRINGQVVDAATNAPIPNILVMAGGSHTLTTSDGSYLLEGLPPGTHHLVAYALDGTYRIFQQGAIVAGDSTTPAPLRLTKAEMVKITFNVTVPKETLPAVPIRMAGNLYQLGNTFADLGGGVSTIASRMPVLSPLPDGKYAITLDLPAGADIRYKYTLGDGLWNAEHTASGEFVLRQLIVPSKSMTVEDKVKTWSSGKSAPITFDVSVPNYTPANDRISIQLNPSYGWTEPLPMWRVSETRWIFVLYSPLETLGAIGYRYCRNEQCGSADDIRSMGPYASGQAVSTSLVPETIDTPVQGWAWLPAEPFTPPEIEIPVKNRGANFMAGVEFQPSYQPSWQPYFPLALQDVQKVKANWVILTPTWTFTRANLPVLEPLPGHDPLWTDISEEIAQAGSLGLKTALFPTPIFPGGADAWWKNATRDFSWWNVWFERYRLFLLHHADLATRQGAQALIIGGDWVAPALPNGTLSDGKPSSVPSDTLVRWEQLIKDVREHYKGALLWALPYPEGASNPPAFIKSVDQVYLLWNAQLEKKPGASTQDMAQNAITIIEENLRFFRMQVNKPLVVALTYPSVAGGAAGCLKSDQAGCLPMEALSRPNADIPSIQLDLQDQSNAYAAMFKVLDGRDSVVGIVTRGYYPPVLLQDKSLSTHGKPAWNVLAYWFPRLLGITK